MMRPVTRPFALAASRKSFLGIIAIGATLTVSGGARADANYQGAVATFVKVDRSQIPCGSCHDDPDGGGTRGQPFYFALIDHGLQVGSPETVAPALEQIDQNNIDSDNDQAEDVAELAAGTSPNNADSKPPPDTTNGSGGSGGGNPPSPPAGSGGSGSTSGTGGRAGTGGGSTSTPKSNSNDGDDDEAGPNATATSCSFGVGGPPQGLTLLGGLAFVGLALARRKRR